MKLLGESFLLSLVTAVILCGSAQSFAGVIVGGSTLLSSSDELQLEAWLGQGSLTLTNVFTKTTSNGKQVQDFHIAADGKGATFSVFEVLAGGLFSHQIVGGYNPQSWNSSGNFNYASTDAERTAFLFNLTSNTKLSEKLTNATAGDGRFQTFNHLAYGPAFGGGFDLVTYDNLLRFGYAKQFSYGNPATLDDGSLLTSNSPFEIGTIEVFTIGPYVAPNPVPEPSSVVMISLGGIGFAIEAYQRRRAAAV